jgi:diacylglycerol O-acyltransferase
MTVTVVALTAGDRLAVTLVVDPARVPDLDRLAAAVREGFAALADRSATA